jgi:hypothetical protein
MHNAHVRHRVCAVGRRATQHIVDAEHFRQLLTGQSPFASVYFEVSHRTADAQLRLKWRDVQQKLVQQGLDDALIDDIESAVMDLRPPTAPSGRAITADADGVILNEHLRRPGPTVVRVSRLPYVVPVVEQGFEDPYLLVEADRTGAGSPYTATARNPPKPSTAAAIRCSLDAVCAALNQGAVETLIVGDIDDATVVTHGDLAIAAPNPDVLSEYGAAPTHTLRPDEALPIGAIAIGAAIVGAGDRIAPTDGVGAVVRYPATATGVPT